MKKTLIIYCHPYSQSFNHAIKETVESNLVAANEAFSIIDLYQDKFEPAYTSDELALFKDGKTLDPLVTKYMRELNECSDIVAIFPIWWSDVPGMMKGFFDKVMKMNFAYKPGKAGVQGLLTHIDSFTAITTSTSPTWYLRLFCGNAIQSVFLNAAVKQVGIKKRKWINCGNIGKKSEDQREAFLSGLRV